MSTQKQIEANQQNGKLGGVKTEEGKNVSEMNSVKHGILQQALSEYEEELFLEKVQGLFDSLKPEGVAEEMIAEIVVANYVRVFRAQKAEQELIKSRLHPEVIEDKSFAGLLDFGKTRTKDGYCPKLTEVDISQLSDTYSRYQSSAENRLYRALGELRKLKGERIGFVSQN